MNDKEFFYSLNFKVFNPKIFDIDSENFAFSYHASNLLYINIYSHLSSYLILH